MLLMLKHENAEAGNALGKHRSSCTPHTSISFCQLPARPSTSDPSAEVPKASATSKTRGDVSQEPRETYSKIQRNVHRARENLPGGLNFFSSAGVFALLGIRTMPV